MTTSSESPQDVSAPIDQVLNSFNLSLKGRRSLRRLFSEEALRQLGSGAADRAAEFEPMAFSAPDEPVCPAEYELRPVLPVKGQGTVRIKLPTATSFRLIVSRAKSATGSSSHALVLEVRADEVSFRERNDSDPSSVLTSTNDPKAVLAPGEGHHYWFSIDKKNRVLRYGRGYPQRTLTLLSKELPARPEPGEEDSFAWLEDLRVLSIQIDLTPEEASELEARVWPEPVTSDLSPRLISSDALTLDDIESGHFTIVQDLGPESERLYENVAGPGVRVSPTFVDALRASLADPKRMCAQKLEEKAKEFGAYNPKATYLRVTVGNDQGNSPGAPFVVEIWPPGNYSPIHSHSDSFAIIKVMHGSITSRYFSELNVATTEPYQEATLEKGDITWLSPEFYQTHQLYNPGTEVCVTIQCYSYGESDHVHYEYFDYIRDVDGTKSIAQFFPNKDWAWGDFQAELLAEYKALGPYNPPPVRPQT